MKEKKSNKDADGIEGVEDDELTLAQGEELSQDNEKKDSEQPDEVTVSGADESANKGVQK